MILAGDIGGTNTRLALFEKTERGFMPVSEENFSSVGYQSFTEIIEKFLARNPCSIDSACFGVAGPVQGKISKITNLTWIIDADAVGQRLKLDRIGLINDLEANVYGINELNDDDFLLLNAGSPEQMGNRALISAGTGINEAVIINRNNKLYPLATESGHADFAARNDLEIELLKYLTAKYGRVSLERVVSGLGLQNIYNFLRETKRADEPNWLAEEMRVTDNVGALISQMALAGKSEICIRALSVFVSLYGAETGNMALRFLATGGVYIGGGIAPKILPKLTDGEFLESFFAKGRMRELVEAMPVRVILNDKTALIGAAHYAFYEMN